MAVTPLVLAAALAADPPAEAEVVIEVRADRPLELRSPASVTVLRIDDAVSATEDVADLVGSASGVSVTRLGGPGDLSTVSIRGSSARQVEVLLDGMPLNPDGGEAVDLSELPMRAFERIEVWRGNAPVGVGGAAMGGVINLVTGDRDATAAGALASSWSTSRIHALASRSGRAGSLWAAAQLQSSVGAFRWYDDRGTLFDATDDRWQQRTNNDRRLAALTARYRVGDRVRWTVFDSLVLREQGIPGPTSAPSVRARYAAARNLLGLQLDAGPATLRLHHRLREERLLDPGGELGRPVDDGRTRLFGLGAELRASGALGRSSSVVAHASVRREGASGRGARVVWRAQAGLQQRVGVLTFAPALTASGIDSRGAGASSAAVALPRLGVLWSPGERWTLKGNVGRYFRPPDLVELFGDRGALAGRADLRPERGLNADLGARYDASGGAVEVGGFVSRATDLLTYVQNAQRISVPVNLGAATVAGLEVAATAAAGPFDSRTNLTLQRAINTTDEPAVRGRRLPRLPSFELEQRTALALGPWRVGHRFRVQDGIYLDPSNLQRTATRPLHDLFARVRHRSGLSLEVDLRNLTNLRAAPVPISWLDPDGPRARRAITDFAGYPLPGRSVGVSLRFDGTPP